MAKIIFQDKKKLFIGKMNLELKKRIIKCFWRLSRIFSAGLNPAKPDFSGWLRLSKIAAG